MQDMTGYYDVAHRQLGRLKGVAEAEGFSCHDVYDGEILRGIGLGVGFAIPLSDGEDGVSEVAAVSLSCGSPQLAYLTGGVLRDVTQDRMTILETCNRATWDNPGFPAFLHANDLGWDVLLQTRLPVEAFVGRPDLFGALVGSMPKFLEKVRAGLVSGQVTGSRYGWNTTDVRRLVGRSLS
jgi:hypothetical protein